MSIKPFDEHNAAELNYRSAISITGSNLTQYDVYRQGVELTLPAHYYMGSAKVSSGFTDHLVPQMHFGQLRQQLNEETWHLDIDASDAILLITSSNVLAEASNGNNTPQNTIFDGVLEPLTIRSVISNLRVAYEIHSMHGLFVAGNEEKDKSTDTVEDIYEFNNSTNNATFADITVYDIITSSFAYNAIIPWADSIISSGSLQSTNMDITFRDTVLMLGSTQDTFIPKNKKSMTSGFIYDSAPGTDSLAFGGFFYVSSSVYLQ